MSSKVVVEWAPFRIADGVSVEQLLAASRELQESFLAGRRGFLRRELLRGKAGGWVDLVHWADQQAADEAMKAAAESPICLRYFHLMAGAETVAAGTDVLHFDSAATYGVRSGA